IFLKRKRHHGIDAEILEILDPVDNIENLADAVRPDVSAKVVLRIEDADVKLIDDEIAEGGRTKVGIVPRIVRWVAYDTVAVRIAVELELARIGVALESF